MTTWIENAVFYHIYPLGLLNAPKRLDEENGVVHRLADLEGWIEHLISLGCNAVYLGPVFESVSHGYDTIDYVKVDPRLGDNNDLTHLVACLHEHDVRVILDGVFNHVGRGFAPFQDLLTRGAQSEYRDWFIDVNFDQQSPIGDPFSYFAYEGNFDLVKLNHGNAEVREYLFSVARKWFSEFGVDGIRFDAIEEIDPGFIRDFVAVCREANPDCWLMGEVLKSDYRGWVGAEMLDSCTNYEAFAGLHSSFNDRNMFEIAHSLNRQFGPEGIYRDMLLYSFADNHDVNRIASLLQRKEDLAGLSTLLYTMPGIPSIYYGSEWGVQGKKRKSDDSGLRPAFTLPMPPDQIPDPWLAAYLANLATIREIIPALRHGEYQELHVASEQFAFLRQCEGHLAIVVVNAASAPIEIRVGVDLVSATVLTDQLDESCSCTIEAGQLRVILSPNSSRILTTDC